MEYKFATERSNYSDLTSGRVFYSLPGHPAFPVRLASEIYQRCLAYFGKESTAYTIYDPCCGAAYHLSVVAYLHWDSISQIVCSDIDEKAVQLAERNLGLLTPAGMERRVREISAMVHLYGKESHKDALESIHRLQEQVTCLTAIRPMKTLVFRANVTDGKSLQEGLQDVKIDIVFTDIPYGQHSQWLDTQVPDPVAAMLAKLHDFVNPKGILAIASDKGCKINQEGYRRLEKFQIGKRQVVILRPL